MRVGDTFVGCEVAPTFNRYTLFGRTGAVLMTARALSLLCVVDCLRSTQSACCMQVCGRVVTLELIHNVIGDAGAAAIGNALRFAYAYDGV